MDGAAHHIPVHIEGVLHPFEEFFRRHLVETPAYLAAHTGREGGAVAFGTGEIGEDSAEFLAVGIIGEGNAERGGQSRSAEHEEHGQTEYGPA